MLSANDVRNITFSKQVGGYRREEVDVFLDKVESDYENYERTVRELNARIHELENQISESKSSEGSIQNVLVSAQKLADSIIAEAKEKSLKIVDDAKSSLESFKAREKELSGAFNKKAEERKQSAREALDKIIDDAKANRDAIADVTQKTVKKQAELYNRLKLETAAFKAEIMDKYKKQLELISKIPDSIPASPEEIAAAVELNVDELSDKESFIKGLETTVDEAGVQENAVPADDTAEQTAAPAEPEVQKPAPPIGFVVNTFDDGENDE